jgi:superfamily II DNA or RNA helicase
VVEERNTKIVYDYNFQFKLQPRDYQNENVALCLTAKHGLVNLAMSSGKTLIFVILSMILRKNRVLILTHRKEIYDEILGKFKEYLGKTDVGEINSEFINISEEINIAMVQTFMNRLEDKSFHKWFDSVNVIIVDEAHHLVSTSYVKIMRKSRAFMRFGFTGTLPEDQLEMFKVKQFFGEVISKIGSHELIEKNFTTRPIIHVIRSQSVPVTNYQNSLKHNVVYNLDKNVKILKLVERHNGKRILVITDYINHGWILSRSLSALNLRNEFLYSQTEDRKKILASFAAGRIPIIVSTNILDEGVDIKDISVLILAFPRKSYRQVLQRIGRGLRKAKNKDFLTVYDFLDEEDKYLKSHYLKRTKYYEKEQFEYKFEDIPEDAEGDKIKFETVCKVLNEEFKEQSNGQT